MAFFTLIACMFAYVIVNLYNLTVVRGEDFVKQGVRTKMAEITVSGKRGSIMDINGIPLAYDVESYDVQFYKNPEDTLASDIAFYTGVICNTIDVVEKHGGKTIDSFLIDKAEDGKYIFKVDDLSEDAKIRRVANWCINMTLVQKPQVQGDTKSQEYKDAFFAEQKKIYESANAEAYYHQLRNKYRISETMNFEQAAKILSIWQEVQLMTYKSYIPITIAYNVDFKAVSEIEARAAELSGMSIVESSSRVYPKNDTAAHIVGYIARLTDNDDIDYYLSRGYSQEDRIGKVGVESTMEQYLSGVTSEKKGTRFIEVDKSSGKVLSEVAYTRPKDGDNVVLTIDLKLQEVLENALERNIQIGREEQLKKYESNKEEYDEKLAKRAKKELMTVSSGCAIAMSVRTGEILALANFPAYDLNLFIGGITKEQFEALKNDPARPLFNTAISSKSMPGSIFKMVTAVAAVKEEIASLKPELTGTETETELGVWEDESGIVLLSCQGKYTKGIKQGARAPACWVGRGISKHSHQNLSDAIKNSCNYYFYTMADRMGIDTLNKWADEFGLTSKTGIELTSENSGVVGNQTVLYDNTKSIEGKDQNGNYKPKIVHNQLKDMLRGYGKDRNIEYTEEQIKEAADRIIVYGGQPNEEVGPEIRKILSEVLDIPNNYSQNKGWSRDISDTIRELRWTNVKSFEQGAGAPPTQLTPIGVVRYVSALANGGKVFKPHIVDRIINSEGEIVMETKTEVVNDLMLPEDLTQVIKKGMEEVLMDGTAKKAFENFEYKDQLAGKTGTARISEIDIEDHSWMVTFAPKENPEVALVVFVPNGLVDNPLYQPTAQTTQSFWQYYFDSKLKTTEQKIPQEGTLIG